MRQAERLRDEILKLEAELAVLAGGSAMLKPDARRRVEEILEALPRLRGEVAQLIHGGPSRSHS
jgi:hypothetical protein